MNYVAPWWLPGGNLQTIWPALYARRSHRSRPDYRRERWVTPDQDFVDVDWLVEPVLAEPVQAGPSIGSGRLTQQPLLVLFHGLEGSSRSHYAEAFADFAREYRMAFAVPHFRGCSGELNQAPRAYHSGDHEEIGWMLQRLRAQHAGPIVAVGVSLGGNALLRWAAEAGDGADSTVEAVASVCSPVDLAAGGWAIGRGFNRLVYTRMFMRSMRTKALAKLDQLLDCSTAPACWLRATCVTSTNSSPRRCTVFAMPRITTPGPRPSRTCTGSGFRHWCSMPATILSSLHGACRRHWKREPM